MPNAKLGVIFDLDGVLLDTAPFHRDAWRQMAAAHGFTMQEDFFWRTFGQSNDAILPQLFDHPLAGDELLRLSEQKERFFRNIADGSLHFFPGLERLLDTMRKQDMLLAVGTSTPRSNMAFFRSSLGFDDYFDAYACIDDVRHGKPAPDIFCHAAAQLQLAPAQCVVIEDALPGLEAAKQAGMKCIAVGTTHTEQELVHHADVIVKKTGHISASWIRDLVYGNGVDPAS